MAMTAGVRAPHAPIRDGEQRRDMEVTGRREQLASLEALQFAGDARVLIRRSARPLARSRSLARRATLGRCATARRPAELSLLEGAG